MRLADIAACIDGVLTGDPDTVITGLSPLDQICSGQLGFILNAKTWKQNCHHPISGAVVTFKPIKTAQNQIITANPRHALATLTQLFSEKRVPPKTPAQIHPSVQLGHRVGVGAGTQIGANTQILDGVTIGKGCRIGENCKLFPGVVLYDGVHLGNGVRLHANAVIGSDGFGYEDRDGTWVKIVHLGGVVIGDEVEIGANTCVARGCLGDTVIESGTKIDNLVQVAHNCRIGQNCAIVSGVLLAGSVGVGNGVQIGGHVAVNSHVKIGDRAKIMGWTGVTKDIEAGQVVSGYPARPHTQALRTQALHNQRSKQLPNRSKNARMNPYEVSN